MIKKLRLSKCIKILVCFLLLILLSCSGFAEENKYDYSNLEKNADILRSKCEEVFLSSETVEDDEYLERNYQSTIKYDKITKYIKNNDDELRQHFSGAYIDKKGFLVIMLSCDSGHCRSFLEEFLDYEEIRFLSGKGSWYEVMQELDEINMKIGDSSVKIYNKESVDESLDILMASHPRTEYNYLDNVITIVFHESKEFKEKISDQELFDNKQKLMTFLQNLFTECFGTYRHLQFRIGEGDGIEGVDYSTAWRPGRAIFVYKSDINTWVPLSSGYRATYAYNGLTYYGYVTAGHTTEIGDAVYICTGTTSVLNKLGVINFRMEQNTVDASFFRFATPYYTTQSNAIYYTSSQSGVTTQGTVLDGTSTDVCVGSCIYKSGQSSYLTTGYVSNANDSYTASSGIYFYDIIQADRDMVDSGDSGGITYIISNAGATSGKAVGIVKGAHSDNSTFIKAKNIKNVFGAHIF